MPHAANGDVGVTRQGGDSDTKRVLESLDPVPPHQRTWTAWTYTSMWAGISVQPTSFIFGAALLGLGLSLAESAVALVLGNCLLLVPLVLNAFPGAKYGIPFPVLARSVFGLRGAAIAVLLRGLVGVGWCGFNLWVGAQAMSDVLGRVAPRLETTAPPNGVSPLQGVMLGVFVLLHFGALWAGVARLQPMLRVSSWIQCLGALALTIWVFSSATFSELVAATEELRHDANNNNSRLIRVLVGATAACSGWSTLALNIADLSRFAASRRAVIWGQVFMFPLANICCPLIGALALGATRHLYGTSVTTTSWNLTAMFRYWPPAAGSIAALVFAWSIFTTNLVANVLSAGNDFASITPKFVGFRGGCLISIAGGVALNPWSTFASASGFVNGFMVCYSIVTGAILGVMLVDYSIVKRQRLSTTDLYKTRGGDYEYTRGFNLAAWMSVVVAVIPCLPGLVSVSEHGFSVNNGDSEVWVLLYDLAWPVTVILASILYGGLHLMTVEHTGKVKDEFAEPLLRDGLPSVNLS